MKEIWAFTQHSIEYCVVVAHDRNDQILSQVAGKGRVTATELDGVLVEYLDNSALLCTDTATNYKKFAIMKGLQHVNGYHKRLKKWIDLVRDRLLQPFKLLEKWVNFQLNEYQF